MTLKSLKELLSPIAACMTVLLGVSCFVLMIFVIAAHINNTRGNSPASGYKLFEIKSWVSEYPVLQTDVCRLAEDGTISVFDHAELRDLYIECWEEAAFNNLVAPCGDN